MFNLISVILTSVSIPVTAGIFYSLYRMVHKTKTLICLWKPGEWRMNRLVQAARKVLVTRSLQSCWAEKHLSIDTTHQTWRWGELQEQKNMQVPLVSAKNQNLTHTLSRWSRSFSHGMFFCFSHHLGKTLETEYSNQNMCTNNIQATVKVRSDSKVLKQSFVSKSKLYTTV